jgi:hypothetical protein
MQHVEHDSPSDALRGTNVVNCVLHYEEHGL